MFKYAMICAAMTTTCLAGEGVELQYRFDADEPTRYEMVQSTGQNQSMQGMTMDTDSTSTTRMVTELIKTNKDGSIVIANTTQSVNFSLSAPGTELSYDSTNPADQSKRSDPMIASIAATEGMEVQLLIGPSGSVLDVPNFDAIQAQIQAMPDQATRASIEPMMNREAIIVMNEMNYNLLPDGEIEIGDQWRREFKIPAGFGEITSTLDLTLDGVKDGVAKILISGTMSMPAIHEQGITMTMSDTSLNGMLAFDIDAGLPNQYDLTTEMVMVGTMSGMADPVLTMKMSQSVKTTRLTD